MGSFFGVLFIFLLFTYLDAPNLREIGMKRDEIKEHQRGNRLILLVGTAIIGVLSIPYYLLYQLFPNISYFWYLVFVIGGGVYWFLNWIDSKPK
jgi:hypothetical protein